MRRKLTSKAALDMLPYIGSAVLVCVLIVVLTGVVIWQESVRFRERSELFTQNAAIMLTEHITDVFEKGDALLNDVAYYYINHLERGEVDSTRFQSYLAEKLRLFKDFRDIRVVDAEGILRFGTGEISPVNLADRDYFTRLRDQPAPAVNDPIIFSGPIYTRLSNKWVLVMARRLQNTDGSFAGIVFANLNVEDITSFFSTINIGPGGAIVLRTSDMAEVARFVQVNTSDSTAGNRQVSQTLLDLVKRNPEGGSYRATSPIDRIQRYYSVRKVDEFPFYIIVGQATGSFVASWGVNMYLLLAFSGLMILATLGGFWRFYGFAQERIRENIDKNAVKIIEATPVAMLMFDDQGFVTKANPAAMQLFGFRATESLTGISVDQLQPVRATEAPASRAAQSTPEGKFSSEGTYHREDGSHFTALRSIAALSDDSGKVTSYLETLVDITALKEAQENLWHMAQYDTLTRLPNRNLFFELVDRALALARRENSQLAILFLDLDKFKSVNDTRGHAAGDLVLQTAAERIAKCLRESDTVGRVGGDEFLALLPNLKSVQDAVRVGEKIREALNQPFMLDGEPLSISSCIGIAIYPDHGSTADSLTEHADGAMYRAKESGRNQVTVYETGFTAALS